MNMKIEDVKAKDLQIMPVSAIAGIAEMKTVSISQNIYGIKDFKDLWLFLLALGHAIESSMKDDGRIDIKDSFKFFEPVTKLPSVITGYQNIGKEALDLTEEEINELIEAAKNYASGGNLREMAVDLAALALQMVKFYGKHFHKAV